MAQADKIQTDLLVIGGGTAGFGAAIAGARLGLDVHLLEASQKIGGVMASCPGMPWGAAFPNGRSIGGIMEELAGRLFAMEPPMAERRPCTLENFGDEIIYDHEVATLTLFEMLEEAGVHLHLGAVASEPIMDGNCIAEVRFFDRHGEHVITPKMVIDCSGDADISAKAGVPFELGDARGNQMGVTLTFMMVGADWDKAFADPDPYFTRYAARGIAQGCLHEDLKKLYVMKGFHPGQVFFNSVVIKGVDGTDPGAVARATQEGRRRCHQLAAFVRDEIPGFENAQMVMLGPTVGVRETRKLEGQYRLKGEDLARATKFPDGIVACDNPIDDVMRDDNEMTHDAIVEAGAYYTIPLRSLTPQAVGNLMFAGRIISADPVAFASVRGMPQCMAMGQAAATAAALAIRADCAVQDVDAGKVVTALRAQGLRGL